MTISADGRAGFPDIFQYKLEDGTMLDVPPTTSHPVGIKGKTMSVPYTLVVYDEEKFRALRCSGWLYSREHRGPVTWLDARITS